jgi:hypothetical protein
MGIRSEVIMAATLSGLCCCSSPGVLAVPEASPRIHGYELLSAAQTDTGPFSMADLNGAADVPFQMAGGPTPAPARLPLLPGAAPPPGRSGLASERSLAWGGSGWPVEMDLGAGEFPYDDRMHPVDGTSIGEAGFSSSIIRVTWRGSLSGAFGIHGTAALRRAQEDPLLDVITDMRLSWLAVGLHVSF